MIHVPQMLLAAGIVAGVALAGNAETPCAEARAWVDRGLALNDNSAEEEECYRKAVELDPTYAAAYFDLAYVLQAQERYTEALAEYRHCLDREPDHTDALRNAGSLAWLVERDAQEARRYLNRYVELCQRDARCFHSDLNEVQDQVKAFEDMIAGQKACVFQDFYSADEIIRILTRRITRERGGGALYGAGRAPMVLFESRSAILRRTARRQLDEVAAALRDPRLAEIEIVIETHTDSHGDSASNRLLSQRRAERVTDYLADKCGLARERFEVRWYGEDRPVAPNATRDGRRKNGRVEVNNAAACWP